MKLTYILLTGFALLFLVFFGLFSYVGTLDKTTPNIRDAEKKGRAKYLIDARLPLLDLKEFFGLK